MLPMLLLGGIAVFMFKDKIFKLSSNLPTVTAKYGPVGDSSVTKGSTVVLPTNEYENIMALIKNPQLLPMGAVGEGIGQPKQSDDEVTVDKDLLDTTRQRVGTDASATWWNDYKFEDGGDSGFDFSSWLPEGLVDYIPSGILG